MHAAIINMAWLSVLLCVLADSLSSLESARVCNILGAFLWQHAAQSHPLGPAASTSSAPLLGQP